MLTKLMIALVGSLLTLVLMALLMGYYFGALALLDRLDRKFFKGKASPDDPDS